MTSLKSMSSFPVSLLILYAQNNVALIPSSSRFFAFCSMCKGQFYTPAEVSRILAKIIGIDKCTDHDATVCDPACGSGSLLIRALAEAPFEISGYGQEKDGSTAGLAKMNAVLHNKATILEATL